MSQPEYLKFLIETNTSKTLQTTHYTLKPSMRENQKRKH